MSATLQRKWVQVAGGSCDVRVGSDALDQAGRLMVDAVGRPRACLLVVRATIDATTLELLRRQAVDAGFAVSVHTLGDERACTLEQAVRLYDMLGARRLTGEDLCCVRGDADLISLVSYVCGSWCAGMPVVAIPTNEVALLDGVIVPRSLDVGESARMVAATASVRHALVDEHEILSAPGTSAVEHARALEVATAMAASERVFSELWDCADALAKGDVEVSFDQLIAMAKARGQASASTAAAIRQATAYGQSFAHALASVADVSLEPGVLLAEGMRFCARVSVAQEKLSLDDMLAQDELLQTLGVGSAVCDVDPVRLVDALKEEHFRHANRFMLLVPLAIGRVRYASVTDDLLLEHARAWCAAHAVS